MKIIIYIINIILTLVLSTAAAFAQPLVRVEIPSSPNPVGSGARALGMGGAFIAIADDTTAASWNPGGLIQLKEPEVSIVSGYVHRKEDISIGRNPETSFPSSVEDFNLNYLSAALPFRIAERNMVISLNYQHLFDFNRKWNFQYTSPSAIYRGPISYDYEQKGDLYATGLSWCVQLDDGTHENYKLSAGFTLNYWGDFLYANEWEQRYIQKADIALSKLRGSVLMNQTEQFSFDGWNANLGFRLKLGKWRIGGVFKTPFTADIGHTLKTDQIITYLNSTIGTQQVSSRQEYQEEIKMPMSYGIGIGYFAENFTLAADIYRTHWNNFELRDSRGNKTSPISGKKMEESDIDPVTWFRIGYEYLIINAKENTKEVIVPLRIGLFYDPAPAEGSPDDYYGFSIGSGLLYKTEDGQDSSSVWTYKGFSFDVAYQFRFGNNVGKSILQDMNFSQDVREHKVYASMIMYFK